MSEINCVQKNICEDFLLNEIMPAFVQNNLKNLKRPYASEQKDVIFSYMVLSKKNLKELLIQRNRKTNVPTENVFFPRT